MSTEERLYRLGTLRSPNGVDWCCATRAPTTTAANSWNGWNCSSGKRSVSVTKRRPNGSSTPANQVGDRFVLWDVNGTPVSMAMLRAPAADVSRIGPVFTPRNLRGHGYGSAVTAAAADLAHRSGTPDVVLFADLANPVSNAIYQRIGFEPVADSVRIDFGTLG